jgi:hypothetical protein
MQDSSTGRSFGVWKMLLLLLLGGHSGLFDTGRGGC